MVVSDSDVAMPICCKKSSRVCCNRNSTSLATDSSQFRHSDDVDDLEDEADHSYDDEGVQCIGGNKQEFCLVHKGCPDDSCNNSSGVHSNSELSRSASRCSSLSSKSSNSTTSTSGGRFNGRIIEDERETVIESPTSGKFRQHHVLVDENNNTSSDCVANFNDEKYSKKAQPEVIKQMITAQAPLPPPPPPPPPMLPSIGLNQAGGPRASPPRIDAGADLRQAIEQHRSKNTASSDESNASDDHKPNLSQAKNLNNNPLGPNRNFAAKLCSSSNQSDALAAFIPPKFVQPPENGSNIKPSEYLRRISAPPLSSDLSSSSAKEEVEQSSTASKVNNSSSKPCDSPSDDHGSSNIAGAITSTTATTKSSDTCADSDKIGSIAPSFAFRQQLLTGGSSTSSTSNNRFRQMAALKKSPKNETLHRSQSTSALNRLRVETDHSDDEEHYLDGHKDSDSVVSDSSNSSCSGSNLPAERTDGADDNDCSILPSMRDFRGRDRRQVPSSKDSSVSESGNDSDKNLMNALRNFDRTKYLKSVNKGK